MTFLSVWGLICGIIYTTAWSASFYGQIYDNWRYKSVQGFSLNYQVFNTSGYIFYFFYCTLGYFFHQRGAGTVVVSDLFFAYHAIVMVFIQGVQCIIYKRGKNRVSEKTIILSIGLWIIIIVQILFGGILNKIPSSQYWNPCSALGYGKLLISFMKYVPAVYWNYKRKSTKGWNISNMILDMIGGVFSLASGTIQVDNGLNITKLVLAGFSFVFDIIFLIQHYVLYRKNNIFHYDNTNQQNLQNMEGQNDQLETFQKICEKQNKSEDKQI